MGRGTVVYAGGLELPDRNAAAHRVLSNAKLLRRIGFEVVLVGITRDLEVGGRLATKSVVDGFDAWSFGYPSSPSEWAAHLGSTSQLRHVMAQYDDVVAVICYNYPSLGLAKTLWSNRRRGIKTICDCTEWYGIDRTRPLASLVKAVDTWLRMRVLHKTADGVICISSYLDRYYCSHVPTVKLPPLVDLDEPKWNVEADAPVAGDRLHFVYAGEPGVSKDLLGEVLAALDGLHANDRYELRIVGVTRDEYLGMHPQHSGLLQRLAGNVEFLGRASHASSLESVRRADYSVFVRLCSRSNQAGFPTKFVESIACGTPVITTACSDVPSYVDHGRTGFIVRSSSGELTSLMSELVVGQVRLHDRTNPRVFDYRTFEGQVRAFLDATGLRASTEDRR
ncbi:MAG: glycosyltransferase [Coriobacteriia bacterium]